MHPRQKVIDDRRADTGSLKFIDPVIQIIKSKFSRRQILRIDFIVVSYPYQRLRQYEDIHYTAAFSGTMIQAMI
jgi:hypothetical protein